MTAVRKIEISDNDGVPKFRFDSAGLPERPVIMHTCASCLADAVITNKDAGDLAAWLIGEAVDDAHGRGVIAQTYEMPEDMEDCREVTCRRYGEMVMKPHTHTPPWTPSGPDDEAGTGTWPR